MRKEILLVVGSLWIVCSSVAGAACTLVGKGTSTSPYQVGAFAGLLQVGATCGDSATYRLTADIDASPTAVDSFQPITFKGSFHGAGHVIRNLNLAIRGDLSVGDHAGLFGETTQSAVVDSLGLLDVEIPVQSVPPSDFCMHSVMCSTLYGHYDNNAFGGIVGLNRGLISSSWVSGRIHLGGILSGFDYSAFGGIAGKNWGKVRNCYMLASADSSLGAGTLGIVGNWGRRGDVKNCYWSLSTDPQAGGAYLGTDTAMVRVSLVAMKDSATFVGFGFAPDSAWNIVQGVSYPFLRGMSNAQGALNPPPSSVLPRAVRGSSKVSLRQTGSQAILFLPSQASVRTVDISGREISPEVQLQPGSHQLSVPPGSRSLIVQIRTEKESKSFPLHSVR